MKNTVCIMVLIPLLFGSCQRNVYFNDFEKSLLDVYNEGDTLIFESDKGVLDTSYILRKDIGYADWNPFAHSGRYKILIGTIYYGSSKKLFQGNMYPYKILNIGKNHPDSSYVSISYDSIHSSWNFEEFSLDSLESYKIGDGLYRFKISRKEKDSTIETQLFFDLKYGVVKYITADDEVWRRVNIDEDFSP
ncbi:hypothetical protein [Parapedobacter sp. DT-150]|uniref:hypothetical protein n=1 Tax=Parapedobacter sp. DT-150 TaxID=3396162 RepID=UPI003F1BB33A